MNKSNEPLTWGFAILGQDVVIFIFSNMAAVVRAGQASVGFWLLSCTFVFQSAAVPGWGLDYNDTTDQFDFVGSGIKGVTINPYYGNLTTLGYVSSPSLYTNYFYATAASTSPVINTYN